MSPNIETQGGKTIAVEDHDGSAGYTAGGDAYQMDLGRVDYAQANITGTTYVAKVNGIQNGNEVVVAVLDTGAADPAEVAGGTDLSGETITITAYRT